MRSLRAALPALLTLAVLLALLALTAPARADATIPSRVVFRKSDCRPLSFDEDLFAAVLQSELLADGVREVIVTPAHAPEAPHPDSGSLAQIRFDQACSPGPLMVIIDDAATDKSVRRAVDFGPATPSARARIAALAVAELMHASWAELVLPAAPPPRAIVPEQVRAATVERLAPSPKSPPPSPRSRALVLAGAEGRYFRNGGFTLWGGTLGGFLPLHERWARLRIWTEVSVGDTQLHIGGVDLRLATLGVAGCVGRTWDRVALEAGPAFEMGAASIRGRPGFPSVRGASGAGLVALGSLLASGRVRLTSSLWTNLDLMVSDTLRGVDVMVDGTSPVGVRQTSLSARLGLALAL